MYVVKQGGRVDYDYKEIYLDTADELENVDTRTMCTGSVAFVIATSTVYILNSQKQWVAQ